MERAEKRSMRLDILLGADVEPDIVFDEIVRLIAGDWLRDT